MTVRRIFFPLLFALLALAASLPDAFAAEFPRPKGAVNDFAGVIPAGKSAEMEALAREVLDKTGTAVVVATVPTVGDMTADDYATRLYEAWGIGRKGEDKGVLILLALKERRVRIETGYGVEGILPDGRVGGIIDRYALPSFRQGDYAQGLSNTLAAVSDVIARDAGVTLTGRPGLQPSRPPAGTPVSPLTMVLLAVLLLLALSTRTGRQLLLLFLLTGSGRGGRSHGGWGGSSGGFGGFSGGFGGFGGGMSGGGGAGRSF